MPAAEEPTERQVPITREQPAVFADRPLDQPLVRDHLFIGRVVAENPQPARQPAEHGIGDEAEDRLIET